MRAAALILFCGNIAATLLNFFLPPFFFFLALLCLLLWVLPYFRYHVLLWVSISICSNLWVGAVLTAYQKSILPESLQGSVHTVTAVITEPVMDQGLSRRFSATISGINDWPGSHKVLVSWYGKGPVLTAGEVWRFPVSVKRPHGLTNPGSRDRLKWYAEQGVTALAIVRAKGPHERLQASKGYPIQLIRNRLALATAEALPGHETLGMLQGLTIGIKQGISQAQWQMLLVTGTNHLLAISGLHIGLVFGLGFKLGAWAWRRSYWLCTRLSSVRAGLLIAAVFAVIYALLAGFSVSTERSLIMLAVFSWARWRRSWLGLSYSVAIAVILILSWDPLATWSMSFWFSFAAVMSLAYGMQGVAPKIKTWREWMRPQWVVGLLLLPLSLFCFQTSSIIGFIANAIAIPWVSFLVVPIGLIGVACWFVLPSVAGGLWWLAALLLQLLSGVLNFLAHLPYAQLGLAINTAWVLVSAQAVFLILLGPRAIPGRYLALFLSVPLLTYLPPKILWGKLRLTVLDVGQGLAVVAETARHVLVYDTGPPFGPEIDAAAVAILPYLRWRHSRHLDGLVVSHADNDHSGGVKTLLLAVPTERILASVPKRIPMARVCRAGQSWVWDGVKFEMLHPDRSPEWSGNNACCVLKITASNFSVLLPGDIERKAERHLLQHRRVDLKADILVAAHHGSKTSSQADFIAAVKPKIVIFSTGDQNRFKFPHPLVVARYQEHSVKIYDTAKTGAVVLGDEP
jgi:competence protein ComEC